MIDDIPKKNLVNSSLNKECVNFESDEFNYNYLYSDFFIDGTLFLPISKKNLSTSTDVFGFFAKSKYLPYFSEKYAKFIKSNVDKFQIFTNCYVIGSSYGYYHCLLDYFPRLFGINKYILKKIEYIVLGKNYMEQSKALETLLKKLNINKKIIFLDEGTYLFKNSFMPFKQGLIQTINNYKKIFSKDLNHSSFKKIYISRSDSPNRIIENENDLIKYLEKYNFEVYNFSELHIIDQIKLFNESKIIVSMHGAALSNLIFANEGTKVVEITHNFNSNKKSDWFNNAKNIIQPSDGFTRNHFRIISINNNLDHYFYFSSLFDNQFLDDFEKLNETDQLDKVTKCDLILNIDLFSNFFESQILT